ncbi:MAG: acyl carrier protein [Bacteroidales bacterium]|nr:acyl carrier protein [Bacteroidales bacterium]MCF8458659.1 acyl carrier protein [Bacteroidales bacterium]
MQNEDIIQKVNEFLIEEFELDESLIKPDAKLKDDLEIESLDFVDIVVIIEKEFGFKVKGEDMVNVRTLQDLYDYISLQVNK